jgi:hypothetical protein
MIRTLFLPQATRRTSRRACPGVARTRHPQGDHPRRRHDGRGPRVRLREGRLRRGVEGHRASPQVDQAVSHTFATSSRRTNTSTRPTRRRRSSARVTGSPSLETSRGSRPDHRGRLREHDAQARVVTRDRAAARSNGIWASATPPRSRSPTSRPPRRTRRTVHRPALLLARREDAAARDHPRRRPATKHSPAASRSAARSRRPASS